VTKNIHIFLDLKSKSLKMFRSEPSISYFFYMRHVTSVAYQGCGRHGTCHGHQFDGGAKLLGKY